MRFIPAFLGALLVTIGVFLFMQGLIAGRQRDGEQLVLRPPVEIIERQEEQQREETEEKIEQRERPEPVMEELRLAPLVAQPSVELEVPVLEMASGDLDIAAVGEQWSAPLGKGGGGFLDGQGVGAEGFVEVVPYTTRTPNVPELAWKNKISGWVLVAFNVMPDGNTRNVRVLDASPRGVFEEKVIAAVSDWKYSLRFRGKVEGDIVMTQKIEIDWKDFPMNIPNVD